MESNTVMSKGLRKSIEDKIASIAAVADEFPGVVIIHNVKTRTVEYMSPRGLKQLNATLEEVKELGPRYHEKYFNPEDARDYVPKIFGLLERNNDQETISFFQQVRLAEESDWIWHFSASKIFMRDEDGYPSYSITMAFPIDPEHHNTAKVSRLLEENEFLRKNFSKFRTLSKREQEILKLTTLGKSSSEIAEDLFISIATVETHRRNVKKKLKANSSYELIKYAYAFNLL